MSGRATIQCDPMSAILHPYREIRRATRRDGSSLTLHQCPDCRLVRVERAIGGILIRVRIFGQAMNPVARARYAKRWQGK